MMNEPVTLCFVGGRQLAEEADWTDKIGSRPLLEKIHHSHILRKIDKTDDAIRKLGVALEGEEGFEL